MLGLEEDQPIKNVPLHVYNINELLMIDELATSQQDHAAAGGMETHIAVGATNEVLQSPLVRVDRVESEQ